MQELTICETREVDGGAIPIYAVWGVYLGAMAIGAAIAAA